MNLSFRRLALVVPTVLLLVGPSIVVQAKRKGGGRGGSDKKPKKKRNDASCSAGLVQVKSTRSFDDTYNTLLSLLRASDDVFVAQEFDAVKVAGMANVTGLPPNRVVIFGNAQLSTPLLESDPAAGLDLPQKMHVYQTAGDDDDDDGPQVYIGYNAPTTYLDYRYAWMDDMSPPALTTIRTALRSLAANAAGVAASTIQDEDTTSASKRLLHRRPGVYTQTSQVDFATTLARLRAAIPANDLILVNIIDHQANAAAVVGGEKTIDPSTLFLFCFPPFDATLMQSNQCAVADFPLKLLVTEEAGGVVQVRINSFSYLRKRHRIKRGSISETVFNHVHDTVVKMLDEVTAE